MCYMFPGIFTYEHRKMCKELFYCTKSCIEICSNFYTYSKKTKYL